MRTLSLLATLSLAALSFAQRPVEAHERMIWDAYQNFRATDSFAVDMVGSEVYGKAVVPVHATLCWKRSVDPRTGTASRVQVDLVTFKTNKKGEEVPTLRLFGDGINLYRYDLVRGEVSTTTYGFYGNDLPPQYVGTDAPKLLSQLRSATPGLATYLTRLLAEFNPSGELYVAKFNTWTPGMPGLLFDEVPVGWKNATGTSITDPITGLIYPRGAGRSVYFGYDRQTPDRAMIFNLYDADGSEENERWEVQSVTISLRQADRTVGLSLTPTALPDWAFAPQAGKFVPVARGR